MKVQAFRRLQKEDFKDAPEWWARASDVLNKQIEQLTRAVTGRLSFIDNIDSEIKSLEVEHDVDIEIGLQKLKRAPIGVAVLFSHFNANYSLYWEPVSDSKVSVRVKWDIDPTVPVGVRLLMIGS